MTDSQFGCNSGKSSTVPELFPKKYVPLMLWRSLTLKSTLATTFLTPTSLLNPFAMLIVGLLFVGNPLPLQLTVEPESEQPATCKLAGLTVTPAAWRSATASGMLSAQSPVATKRQVPLAGIVTIEGLVIPPKELLTLYIWPS